MNKDILSIDNARIAYKNFSGRGSKFNREGDRNFCVIIDDPEVGQQLANDGWNIKIRPPKEEGDSVFQYLPVKIKFGFHPPKVYVNSGENRVTLDEESISEIDDMDIVSVSLDIRPYDWEMGGKTGRTAYLQSMLVEQRIDRFAREYIER